MKLVADWSLYSDLSLEEAAFLLCNVDPKYHFFRYERDLAYASYFDSRGDIMEEIEEKIPPLISGIRAAHLIPTSINNDSQDFGRATSITLSSFLAWCTERRFTELVAAFQSLGHPDSNSPSILEDELRQHVHDLANDIAQERFRSGGKTSQHSIAPIIHQKLQNDKRFFGQQGLLETNTIRTRYLKGWKFTPPDPA